MELTRDFEGPLVMVRVALQSRDAANILNLEKVVVPITPGAQKLLQLQHQPVSLCDTRRGCVKYCVRDLHSVVKQWIEQLLCVCHTFGLAQNVVLSSVYGTPCQP